MTSARTQGKAVAPVSRPWLSHYDPGVPSSIRYPAHALQAFLQDGARRYPDRACTILGNARVSYREMDGITDRLAGQLISMGVSKGDRVGILMPNLPQFPMAFYGILKAGGVVVATNPLYKADELAHQIRDSGMRLMFVDRDALGLARSARANTDLGSLIVTCRTDGSPAQAETAGNAGLDDHLHDNEWRLQDMLGAPGSPGWPRVDVGPEDIALFQYSGGTTGVSKAAVATHRGVVANTVQFRSWLHTLEQANEVMLMAIPLYHAYGMIAGMSLGLSLAASLALVPNPRDLSNLLSTIQEQRPTVFPGVPSLYSAIANHPDVVSGRIQLDSIRVCISGSTALMRETKERFEALSGGNICEGYGLSEAPVVTHCNPLLGANKIGSIGMPMPDVECRIVAADDPESDVSLGEPGELLLRGPQVMLRYHNLPAETANVLRRAHDGHAWLHTGDIVRMDDDGYFYIVDRKKELIKPGGNQVWPREVEEALAAHPAVLEVGVGGVPSSGGEAVKAWIVLRPGMEVPIDELKEWCHQRLAPFKVPALFEFRTELPKSNVGKVLRRELIRQHREAAE